jgi:hypothetical protein
VAAYRLTGSTVWVSLCLTCLARAYADVGRLDDAWRSINESISAIKGSIAFTSVLFVTDKDVGPRQGQLWNAPLNANELMNIPSDRHRAFIPHHTAP